MPTCFFVSDLHGRTRRYLRLFEAVADQRPAAVFLGGDLLPGGPPDPDEAAAGYHDFVFDFFGHHLRRLRDFLGVAYPRVFFILGNDDPRSAEADFLTLAADGLCEYVHDRHVRFEDYDVYGYACVPPTPFQIKDWERYDVSQYVDAGCVSPEEGYRSVPVPAHDVRHATIRGDLERLMGERPLDSAILLFHSPPYQSKLDRAALDGLKVDHVPLDVHVGSIAIQRFITQRQPLVTLHGHIHESARLTGTWRDRIGRTHCLSAAHGGPELALVRFDPADPAAATRELR